MCCRNGYISDDAFLIDMMNDDNDDNLLYQVLVKLWHIWLPS